MLRKYKHSPSYADRARLATKDLKKEVILIGMFRKEYQKDALDRFTGSEKTQEDLERCKQQRQYAMAAVVVHTFLEGL